jgi:hypothetical protein
MGQIVVTVGLVEGDIALITRVSSSLLAIFILEARGTILVIE